MLTNLSGTQTEGEMQLIDKGTVPFDTIHADHFGPLEKTGQLSIYISNYKRVYEVHMAFRDQNNGNV